MSPGGPAAAEIEHGPFTLRAPAATDIPWVFDACQDVLIQRYTTVPSPYRAADAVSWVRRTAELRAAGSEHHFLVAWTESGELFGAVSLRPEAGTARAEIGYWVEQRARRRGVASSAVQAVEAWAAATLGITETYLRIAEENSGSRAVVERCGYVLEGPSDVPCRDLPALIYAKRRPPGPRPARSGRE